MDTEAELDVALVRRLLRDETDQPRDALPYTEEFERLHALYCDSAGTAISRDVLMRGFLNAGKRGGFGGRRRSSQSAPDLASSQIIKIGRLVGPDLAARGSLVYTPRFDVMHAAFCREFGGISKSEFWLALDGTAKRAKGEEWKAQLQKARESACLAVEIYNKPLATFKGQAFVSLMVIAWTSLLQAFFQRIGIVPVYPKEDDKPLRYWELSTCLKEFYGGEHSRVRINLEFFIGLRNEIEHYASPQIDLSIFGETQAMVMNFEEMIVSLFGREHALADQLSLAIQFSRLRDAKQSQAIRSLQKPLPENVRQYIDTFRSQLSSDVWNSLDYSYRVFLLPKIDSKEKRSDLAVEFAPLDAGDPDDQAALAKLNGMIIEKRRDVSNDGWMKPGKLCREVNRRLKAASIHFRLNPSSSHAKLVRYYGVRPPTGDPHPEKTKSEYCRYDSAHEDYTYSPRWIDFLVEKVADEGELSRALGRGKYKSVSVGGEVI